MIKTRFIPSFDRGDWYKALSAFGYDQHDPHFTSGLIGAVAREGEEGFLFVAEDEVAGWRAARPFLLRKKKAVTSFGYGGMITTQVLPDIYHGTALATIFADTMKAFGAVTGFTLHSPFKAADLMLTAFNRSTLMRERDVAILFLGSPIEEQITHKGRLDTLKRSSDLVTYIATPAGLPRELVWFAKTYQLAMAAKGASARWEEAANSFDKIFAGLGDHAALVVSEGAGAIFIEGGGVAYYLYAARAPDAPVGAADQVILAGAAWAKAQGASWLHLGGGLDDGDSLAAYKMSWGGIRRSVYSAREVYDPERYKDLMQRAMAANQFSERHFPAYGDFQ